MDTGTLVLADTTLDPPGAKKRDLVTRPWRGKRSRVVWGINPLTRLWSDGKALIPGDFRIYDKPWSGRIKNDLFRELLTVAKGRDFASRYGLFASWHSSLRNRKAVRDSGWLWLCQLRPNRQAARPNQPKRLLSALAPPEGEVVHLRS